MSFIRILVIVLFLVTFATAEEFGFTFDTTSPTCRSFTYDTYTHDFKPANCVVNITCRLKIQGSPDLVIFRVPQANRKEFIIYDRDGEERHITDAELSIFLSSGAVGLCSQSIHWSVEQVK